MAAVMSPDESTNSTQSDSASRVNDVEVSFTHVVIGDFFICPMDPMLFHLFMIRSHPYIYYVRQQRLNNEINQLIKDIWRVGDPEKPSVPFGELFDDDDVQQHYEGLAATLKAAKKSKHVSSFFFACIIYYFTIANANELSKLYANVSICLLKE